MRTRYTRKLILLGACLAVTGLLAFACASAVPSPAEYMDDKVPIEVPAGAQFIIALKSNPTTGFKWEAKFDQGVVKIVNDQYTQDEGKPGMTGAGGTQRFTFEGSRKGQTAIALTYRQPWQGGTTGETKSFNVTVR